MKNGLLKFEKGLSNTIKYLMAIMLIATVSLAVLQVFTRYFVDVTIIWIEEVSIIGLTWMACIGTPWMWLEKGHISMDVMNNILPKHVIRIMDIILNTIAVAMGVALINIGIRTYEVNKGFVLSLINYDEGYRYIPLIICGVLFIICASVNIIKEVLFANKNGNERKYEVKEEAN